MTADSERVVSLLTAAAATAASATRTVFTVTDDVVVTHAVWQVVVTTHINETADTSRKMIAAAVGGVLATGVKVASAGHLQTANAASNIWYVTASATSNI